MNISTSITDQTALQRRQSIQKHLDKTYRTKKIVEWLKDGDNLGINDDRLVDSSICSSNTQKSLVIENILFTTRLPIDHFKVDDSISSKFLEDTLDVLKEYDMVRLQAGMNPNTLMTEYRRKVILQSLAYGRSDIGQQSLKKVKRYKQLKEELDKTSFSDIIPAPYHVRYTSSLRPKTSYHMSSTSCSFEPSIQDYDEMMKRWKKVRPTVNYSHTKNRDDMSSLGK